MPVEVINTKLTYKPESTEFTEKQKLTILGHISDNLLQNGSLCFYKYKHDEELTLNEFYLKIFELTKEYPTHNSLRDGEDTGDIDYTFVNKRRSLQDIYRLCNYYYPDASFKEFLTVVKANDPIEYYCPNIKNSVVAPAELRPLYAQYQDTIIWNWPHKQYFYRTFWQLLELL